MPNEVARSLLIIRGPRFYSQTDEDHFFAWLQSISEVEKVTGVVRDLELIVRRPMDEESLRNLIALMRRYDLDRSPLKPLCEEQRDEYLRNAWTVQG
jgi:hypothetical protein